MAREKAIRLRDQRKPGWCWAENELLEVFLPFIGPAGVTLYMVMSCKSRGSELADMSLRQLGAVSGMSKDTVDRLLVRMVALRMVAEERGEKSRTKGTYFLLDLKAAASAGEAELKRLASVSVGDRLGRKGAVKKPVDNVVEGADSVSVGDSLGDGFETELSHADGESETDSGSKRDSYQYWKKKETSNTQNNAPLPPFRGVKSDGDGVVTRTAMRAAFDGVMSDLQRGLMDASLAGVGRMPGSEKLRDGHSEYTKYFADVVLQDFEAAEGASEQVVLRLSAPDPRLASEGFRVYQQRIGRAMVKYFGRIVQVSWETEV